MVLRGVWERIRRHASSAASGHQHHRSASVSALGFSCYQWSRESFTQGCSLNCCIYHGLKEKVRLNFFCFLSDAPLASSSLASSSLFQSSLLQYPPGIRYRTGLLR
ncbi:pentatricopeptide repeat-containing protein [Clarias magur]|uniref:Pentatricopeptide repeat-containing protein n=1 Tax=Clarias magur TaxID=1594786 RepID=A0A8J4TR42_CLAMG|nr:pentatricopeptide repeat-containing protein [Clarias magur]